MALTLGQGTIGYGDFPALFGIFTELNPVDLPVTTLTMAKGLVTIPNKEYTYTYHTNPDMLSVTPTLQTDFGTTNFGSTGFTTGSNTVQIWDEGAAVSYAREGDQSLGRVLGWQDAKNPSVNVSELTRGMADALLRIKTQFEYVAREGVYNVGIGGTGTWQQRGYRYAPGIYNKAAAGAVAGGSAVGSLGTLTFAVIEDIAKTLWDRKGNGNEPLTWVTNSRAKIQLSQIMRDTYNAGKNGESVNQFGISVERFITDFGVNDIVLTHSVPQDQLYVLNMAQLGVLARPVPGKGVLFQEERETQRAGWAKNWYGEIGLNHGNGSCHARIYGIGSTTGHITTGTIQAV